MSGVIFIVFEVLVDVFEECEISGEDVLMFLLIDVGLV